MKAILFKTDGTETTVSPADGERFTLLEMYDLLESSTVELVHLFDNKEIWCDEEGLLKRNWVPNEAATKLYREAHPDVDPHELVIVGNALFIDHSA